MPTEISIEQAFGTGALPSQEKQPFRFGDRTSTPTPVSKVLDAGSDILGTLEGIAQTHGTVLTSGLRKAINYGAGAGSSHTKGLAGDFRTHDLSREAGDNLIADLEAQGFWVNDERDNWNQINPKTGKQRGTGPHIHAEWRGGTLRDADDGQEQPSAPKKNFIPLDEAFGTNDIAQLPTVKAPQVTTPVDKPTSFLEGSKQWLTENVGLSPIAMKNAAGAIGDVIERVSKRAYYRFMSDTGRITPDDPNYAPTVGTNPNLQSILQRDPYIEERRIRSRAEARAKADKLAQTLPAGFWKNLDNPVQLILNDSLPANFVEWLGNSYERGYDKLNEARKVQMQENIAAHPEQFPAVSVQAAKDAIAARNAKKSKGVIEQWTDLKKAAQEDPGRFGAQFINALMADPEMVFAPQGVGLKVATATERLARGTEVASRAAKIADKILDAGSTGAGLNVAMEAAAAGAEGRELTGADVTSAAALGGGLSALVGAFSRGAAAREKFNTGQVSQETFDSILKDVAQEELATEQIVNSPNPIDRSVKHRIEETAGVKFESDADLKQYLETQRKEWRKLFAERDLNGQYQSALAEERISRRTQLAEEGEARVAEEARQREIAQAYDQEQAAKTARFNEDYEKALQQRDQLDTDNAHQQALAEADLRDRMSKLDQQEAMEAAMMGDVPAIRNAMRRAAGRDAKLRVPKWQRGEVDPDLVARLGIGSLFAGTAYALSDDEYKTGAAIAAGLSGVLLPGMVGSLGGRTSRAAQIGAVSLDDIGTLIHEGKLRASTDVAQQMAKDAETIKLAREGDQAAFTALYKDHAPRVQRFITKNIKGLGGRLGIEAEDLAVDTLADAFNQIDTYRGDVPFSAYLMGIARRKIAQAIRDATTEKAGGSYLTTTMYSGARDLGESARAGQITEGEFSPIKGEVEAAAADLDTPEGQAIRAETSKVIMNALEKLSDSQRNTFILKNIEQFSDDEIAQMTGQNRTTVAMQAKTATDKVLEAVEKSLVNKKLPEIPIEIKRGRGRPRKEAGEIDPRLMQVLGSATVGALIGAYLVDNKDAEGNLRTDPEAPSKLIGALAGAGAGVLLFGGKGRKNVAKFAGDLYGASSTAILNRSRAIHKRILATELNILTNTHKHIENVDPFLVKLSKMPKEGADLLARALMTGRGDVINKMLEAFGDKELTATYKKVRATLDSLGDKLVHLKRFSKGNIEYFPRIVKDKEGLFAAIGKEEASNIKGILDQANVESLRKNGRPLSELEESAIINKTLFLDKRSVQPGFSKNRGIEEITPELQKYYASPAESLHSYIRAAVQDIESASFFGDFAKNMTKGNHQFLDVDRSVRNMIAEEVKSGKLSDEDARVISDILRTRFKEGLRAENDTIRDIKNIGNIGLLGNFWSAATQIADVGTQVYVQGLRDTISSVVRQVTGRKLLDMKDFGLADHISEEFAGQLKTSRWVNKVFKATLFAGVDKFGKNTALNAAVIRAQRLAQSESGQLKIANKYQEAFGDDFPRLISELKSGKISDLTRQYAFMELSRTQPVSRIEMPLFYLKNPNLRSYLWLKSFMMKQLDLVRRDALDEMRKGNVAKGIKNLTEIGVVLGLSGATVDVVKDYIHNGIAGLVGGEQKEINPTGKDIVMNMFKTFGFSQFMLDKLVGVSKEEAKDRREAGEKFVRPTKPTPIKALAESFVGPPYRIFDDLFSGDKQKALRTLLPGIGPYLSEQFKLAKDGEEEVENE